MGVCATLSGGGVGVELSSPFSLGSILPPDKQLRCYASNDIAPLRGTVGHHRAYIIGRVGYTLYIVKCK